ncbi:MAG: hypothetical protein HOP19_26205, partial [Acidobacteria bacterium]|nr:hypothetical protein [Acidobacteriota bacterium]
MRNRFSHCGMSSCALVCGWLVLLSAFTPAQVKRQNEDETTIRISTELVILDAQVLRKKNGVVVSELLQND